MKKYDLEWWTTLKRVSEDLGRLDSLTAFDALTEELFADESDLDVFHTVLQWFNIGANEETI